MRRIHWAFLRANENKTQTRVSQSVYPPGYTRATRERKRQRERKHPRTSFFLEKFHVTNPNAPRATNPANVLRLHAFGSANHPPYVVQTCPRIDRGSWCAGAPCPPIFVRSLSSSHLRARPASCGRLTYSCQGCGIACVGALDQKLYVQTVPEMKLCRSNRFRNEMNHLKQSRQFKTRRRRRRA